MIKLGIKDLFLALLVPLLWGMGFVVAKAGLDEFPPLFLMGMRFLLAALILIWFYPPPPGKLRVFFILAFVSATLQYGFTYSGLDGLAASTAVLLVQLEVPFGALLAAVFFKDRLGKARTLGMALAFAGVVMVAGNPTMPGQIRFALLVVAGAFTWAVGQIMIKKWAPVTGFHLLAWIAVFAGPQMIAASLILESGHWEAVRNATVIGWGAVIYLGVVMTAVGYGIWYHVLKKYDVNQVMPLLLLLPVFSIIGAVLFLGERPDLITLTGGAVVICGVTLVVTAGQRMSVKSGLVKEPSALPSGDHQGI